MEEKYASLPVVCLCAWCREWRTGSEKLQGRQKMIYTRIQNDIILDNATIKERNRFNCTYLYRCYLLEREFASLDTKLRTNIAS
jgi:hypothetical protein